MYYSIFGILVTAPSLFPLTLLSAWHVSCQVILKVNKICKCYNPHTQFCCVALEAWYVNDNIDNYPFQTLWYIVFLRISSKQIFGSIWHFANVCLVPSFILCHYSALPSGFNAGVYSWITVEGKAGKSAVHYIQTIPWPILQIKQQWTWRPCHC